MNSEPQLCFPPFRLDLVNEQLWRERQEIPLRQKTFAVLRYLVEHPDQLVTKEALLDAVWAGTTVSDVAPGVCVQELRRALGEDRQTPRFIVTVHRRGYRFIAPLTAAAPPVSSSTFQVSSPKPAPNPQSLTPTLVGRESELAQLHKWLEKALGGERQIGFVTGEPGIGKTTLIDAFLQSLASRVPRLESEDQKPLLSQARTLDPRHQTLDTRPWLARGQCIEQYGPGEPYMPILEALGRLGREPDGKRLIAVLQQHAPTWLVQMPTLLPAAELEVLQRQTQGVTRERMLREMGGRHRRPHRRAPVGAVAGGFTLERCLDGRVARVTRPAARARALTRDRHLSPGGCHCTGASIARGQAGVATARVVCRATAGIIE